MAGGGVSTGAEAKMAFPPPGWLLYLRALPGSADVGRSGWGWRGEAGAGAASAGSAESLRLRSPLPAAPRTFCSLSAPFPAPLGADHLPGLHSRGGQGRALPQYGGFGGANASCVKQKVPDEAHGTGDPYGDGMAGASCLKVG